MTNRKWLFVLPNLFTVSSIFCGIYSMTLASRATGTGDLYRAAIAILFGMFFDGCDGRVARLTRTQSEFGVQLDSLADVVSFGAAPALLLYSWVLYLMGFWGVVIAGIFASCGALRLARFNIMAAKETGPSSYFTGLPIPLGAGVVVSLVVAATQAPDPIHVTPMPIAVITLIISYLMVSRVRYHSFKKLGLRRRPLLLAGAVVLFGVLIGNSIGPNFVLLAYAFGYVLLGLVEELVFHRRRAMQMAAPSAGAIVEHPEALEDPDDDGEDDEDEDSD